MASFDKDTEVKLPRTTPVNNKSPAPVQITAEQILREARERQEAEIRPPSPEITDSAELSDYRLRRRNEFEDQIGSAEPSDIQVWINYARWEESQEDYARARSVWERAMKDHDRNHAVWLKYAESEMKNKFVDSARNVWERAVKQLPRVDQLWCKYIHMEEMLGNISGARQIFERWMNWSPDQQGWLSFVEFELRYNETERARSIFERFVLCYPEASSFIQYAKFEMKSGEVARARGMYELAINKFGHGEDEDAEMLFLAFAEFEEQCKEVERARAIYKLALDHIPKGRAENLYRRFVAFERQYGDKEKIDDAIVGWRRFQYEDQVRKNPLNYESWFDYIRLEEETIVGNKDRMRDIYERAIANVPQAKEKRYWQRYIYLWINYALYEEIEAEDVKRARQVYSKCLELIPHTRFSFAKIWLLAAQLEIRQLDLNGARRILGNAIRKAPKKDKIFKNYIEMELGLGYIDRCRELYERYLEWSPENYYAWRNYAELERCLQEKERARAIFELAISQPALDLPELLWKAYIDFEISQGEFERTRALYERLLHRTQHYKVWISFAQFEYELQEEDKEGEEQEENAIERKKECIRRTRAVLNRAYMYYKDSRPELKEERAKLLDNWLNMEASSGTFGDVSLVQPKLPKKLRKRKPIIGKGGSTEYVEYIGYFFSEELQNPKFKTLEADYRWERL